MAVLLRLPLLLDHSCGSEPYRAGELAAESLDAALERLYERYGLAEEQFYLVQTSAVHSTDPITSCPSRYSVRLRLRGGKGGFGSQLRAQGNKMSSKRRAGNYEACRDLSTGQRLRSSKHTKLIEDYAAREPERMSQREQEIREKMLKHLEAPGRKVMFSDAQYLRESRKLVDGTQDAVMQALVKAGSFDSDTEESGSESDSENEGSCKEDELQESSHRKKSKLRENARQKDTLQEKDAADIQSEASEDGSEDDTALLK